MIRETTGSVQPLRLHHLPHGILQHIAHFALRRCDATIEREPVRVRCRQFRADELRADLRPVAVRENDAVACADEPDDGRRRLDGIFKLLLSRPFLSTAD